MSYKLAQRGSLDNEVINVFFCDEPQDLQQIPKADINLGSVAVVVDPFDMYMANSKKEWLSLAPTEDEEEEEIEQVGEP